LFVEEYGDESGVNIHKEEKIYKSIELSINEYLFSLCKKI